RSPNCGISSPGIYADAPATFPSLRPLSMPPQSSTTLIPMLDLGTSFLASVARDPDALAIVDGQVRLTYRQWYARISALVAGFDRLGLEPGDHLVTVLQNNWQAATVHWACQFAGIVITSFNWRATNGDLDYCLENAEAKALVYEGVSAKAVGASVSAWTRPRISVGLPQDLP